MVGYLYNDSFTISTTVMVSYQGNLTLESKFSKLKCTDLNLQCPMKMKRREIKINFFSKSLSFALKISIVKGFI